MDPPSAPAARSPRRPRAALVILAIVVGLAVGVVVDILQVGGLDAWLAARGPHSSARQLPVPPYEARGRVVAVDGREVYLDCRGVGSPTVILEAGFGSGAGSWGAVLDGVAAFTRVCSWDRPGLGRSTARGLHSGAQTATDLRLALREAGERGPFVVVAHSLGGVYARLFAAAPTPDGSLDGADAVRAFVMIDTYEPDLGIDVDPTLSEEERAEIRESIDEHRRDDPERRAARLGGHDGGARGARAGPPAGGHAVRRSAGPLPPIRTRLGPRRWSTPGSRAIAARYPNGTVEIVPGAGHLIHWDRPDLVIDRIRSTVLAHRSE